ncbi:HNH endonuclease [Phormidium pseudopriestleyi FRX01]|uniref:HNH endonuclease n=1 Tax=Phormidium pseudopriestleyi FRX01 TaxID=1759528 RepID=A0ABS3G067_9CYAN|nr:HNH endonuclease signature motif containing protein [Phormidium pseudopriestleyi]MBO0352373.1 HNH endonuclease [Phormidium pseudopriestleyi FRX01]
MTSKVCSKCGKDKDVEQFEKRLDSKNGRRQYCRACKKVQTDKAIEKWKENNKPQYWRLRADSLNSKGARRKGIAGQVIANSYPFKGDDLKNLYESSPCCYYCGIPLEKEKVVFDHKTPLSREGKHHIENMAISCHDCHQLKGTKTEYEFSTFIEDYIKRFVRKYRGKQVV